MVEELRGIVRTKENPTGTVPGTIALNQAFSRKALVAALNGGYSVLHLASHFVLALAWNATVFVAAGDKTRLYIAPTRGRLRLRQVVALSACETAIGGQADQFGWKSRAYRPKCKIRGQRRAGHALAVHDESTAIVMQQFYRLRVEGKL